MTQPPTSTPQPPGPAGSEDQEIARAIAWVDSIPDGRIAALRAACQGDTERLRAFLAAGGHPDDFDPSR